MASNTVIYGVIAPTSIPYETTEGSVPVTGTLAAIGGGTFSSAKPPAVSVSLKTPCCPQQLGTPAAATFTFSDDTPTTTLAFTAKLALPTPLPPGDYEIEIKLAGDLTAGLEPAHYTQRISVIQVPDETPIVPRPTPCIPCSDPIATVNRVIRDRTVSAAVSELLQGVADKGVKKALSEQGGPLVQTALTTLSKAIAGGDAVKAKGECCKARILVQIALESAAPITAERIPAGKKSHPLKLKAKDKDNEDLPRVELLDLELLRRIELQLINEKGELLATDLTYTREGIEMSVDVPESGNAIIAFSKDRADGAKFSQKFYYTKPGGPDFTQYTNVGSVQYKNLQAEQQKHQAEADSVREQIKTTEHALKHGKAQRM